MVGTGLWIALGFVAVLFEAVSRRPGTRLPGVARVAGMIARRLPGRVLLALIWVFVGVHLFSRYTIPGH